MDVKAILCSLILVIVFAIPQTLSQSTSQQNIQTRYPFSPPPPPPAPQRIPPPPPPPTSIPPAVVIPTPQGPPLTRASSAKSAVGKAIGVTAASTLVLSGLVLFLLLRNSKRKRDRERDTTEAAEMSTNPTVPQTDHFRRFNGNLKGVIVDENGLDVLYWRNLEAGQTKPSFKKQYYMDLRHDQKEEERTSLDDRRRRGKGEPVQQIPLLIGSSSTSQNPVWGEKTDPRMKEAPTVPFYTAPKNQDSSIQVVKDSTPPVSFAVPKGKITDTPPTLSMSTPPLPPPPGANASVAVPKGKITDTPSNLSMSTPPLPPPPGAPPPRSSLTLASGSVPKGKMPSPPPLPLRPLPNKIPAVPPPPAPPSSGGASAPSAIPPAPKGMPSKPLSAESESVASSGSGQVKMKPLHWDKVNPDVKHSMVWDKLDKGSFKFDGDLMEALFGYVATNRKSSKEDDSSTSSSTNKSGPPARIFILDTRKSQNIAIVIKSLGITRKDLINGLLEGEGLSADTIEKLTRIAPSTDELSKITAFHGDPTKLADAESFLYHLLRAVPSAFIRFNALLFKSNYDTEVSHIKESLESLESACKELKTRGLFSKLLEAVLKAGNRLNAGTSRGNAQAFNLTALTKLSDVKSSDGKTTLLQFVVQEVVRAEGKRFVLNANKSMDRTNSPSFNDAESKNTDNFLSKDDREKEYMTLGLPVVGGLSAEFANVKKAATLDYELLVKTTSALAAQLEKARKTVEQCGNEGGFAREMVGFLDTAELEIQVVKEEQTRIIELVRKTTDYYQTGFSSKDRGKNTFQLLVIVRDFLGLVDQVCVDIARNAQKKKPVLSSAAAPASSSSAAGSSSPESPRVFRFPKLPANFMLQHSKSSSTDSDNESEARP